MELYNEDCLKVLSEIPEKSVDLIVTDPPYEMEQHHGGRGCFGIKHRKYHGEISPLSSGITDEVLELMCRVMKKINIYLFCSKEQIRQYLNFFDNKGTSFDLLTWHKTNPIPTCNNKYLSDTEYILFFREKGVNIYGTMQTKRKWYLTPLNTKDKKLYNHPTVKPLEIINNLIENSSNEGDVVLDPFMGSGTTGVSAVQKGRDFIGIEINKEYFDTAQNRIKGGTLFDFQ